MKEYVLEECIVGNVDLCDDCALASCMGGNRHDMQEEENDIVLELC